MAQRPSGETAGREGRGQDGKLRRDNGLREDGHGDSLTSPGSVKWKGSDLTFHPSVAFSLFFLFQYGSRSSWILDCFAFENTAPHPSECILTFVV